MQWRRHPTQTAFVATGIRGDYRLDPHKGGWPLRGRDHHDLSLWWLSVDGKHFKTVVEARDWVERRDAAGNTEPLGGGE